MSSAISHYDVFLSFRGPDTRQGFVDCLYNYLLDAGIRVYKDDDELSIGQPIDEILSAIENSKICMPVFSRSFASSSWCLREVAKMVELEKEIVPIFYDVVPDDVKLQTSLFNDEMRKHETKHGADQVMLWEEALQAVARLKGRELKQKGHYEFSKELAREVLIKLKPKNKHVPGHIFGMDDQVETVLKLIDTESGGVRCVGIHGMGGIGKTTLARVLFNKLSVSFDSCCFLVDIRESSRRHGMEHLQRDLLSNLDPKLKDAAHITDPLLMISKNFRKKVLVVLDDVDEKEQIDRLLGETNRFASGSRIIVTTRNVGILQFGLKSFDGIFEMKAVTFIQGLQLFSHHAFGRDSAPRNFESLSEEVVRSCKGLPLALEVLGSFLCQKDESVWIDTVKKLQKVPDRAVQDKLKISYEALEYEEQQVFLDIACFFVNAKKSYMSYMWDACGFHPALRLAVLVSRSLIKIVEDDKIWMHDHLRDLGREIVRGEGLQHPRSCSRLWGYCEEMMDALKYNERKEDIVGLRLDGPCPDSTGELLSGLRNLRFLSLEDTKFSKNFQHPLPNLRWLSWRQCPGFDAKHLNIRNLVILELQHSSISKKWNGWKHIEMVHLKVLDLTNCSKLKSTPDFSRIPNLERLTLCQCSNLVKLHDSIVSLKYLKYLNLNYCSSLRTLPEEIGSLQNLEQMFLHGCKKLKNFQNSIRRLKSLVALDLSGKEDLFDQIIPIFNLMVSGSMSSLDEDVDWSYLSSFYDRSILGQMTGMAKQLIGSSFRHGWQYPGAELPNLFSDLKALTKLDISYLSVSSLPEEIGNLENLRELKAKRSFLVRLPKSIGLLKSVETLDLAGSFSLEEIPIEIGGLSSLRRLNLWGTAIHRLPSTITELSCLQSLNLAFCYNLGKPENGASSLTSRPVGSSEEALPAKSSKDMTALPTSFDGLLQLEKFELECEHLECIPVLPSSLQRLLLNQFNLGVKLPDVSNTKNLTFLCISFSEEQSQHETLACFPESLRELCLIGAAALPDLSNLKNLQKLVVQESKFLKGIPGLGRLKSLKELYIRKCESLDSLENLSELSNLKDLSIIYCRKLNVVEGLEGLPLVHKDVHFSGCRCLECLSEKTRLSASMMKEFLCSFADGVRNG